MTFFTVSGFLFLPTPSARRATAGMSTRCAATAYFYPRPPRGGRRSPPPSPARGRRYFYPRPPRGGRPSWAAVTVWAWAISTHALREEGDVCASWAGSPRPPISTHALREEGDSLSQYHRAAETDFYPRPPRGGRRSAFPG